MALAKHWTKVFFVVVCSLACLTPLLSQTAIEPTTGTELVVHGIRLNDPLNLRTEPRVGATIQAKLLLGTRIVATGKSARPGTDAWVEVEYQGLLGWVNARFVRPAQKSAVTAAPTVGVTSPQTASPSKRAALVVGNARYVRTAPLANPHNDARAIAAAFQKIGFDRVALHLDLARKELTRVITNFSASAADAKLAVVYFAGHGVQIDGSSYLLPVDAHLERADDAGLQAIELNSLLGRLDSVSGLKLIIVDACRDNPFRARLVDSEASKAIRSIGYVSRSIGRGLARVEGVGHNTLVAYAARDGSFALDGDGQNSPFAAAVLKQLNIPGTEVGLFFRRVRDEVLTVTARRQEPFTYGSIGGEETYLWPIDGGLSLRANDFSTLKNETDGLVSTFKAGDLKALASYVHPIIGVNVDGVTLTRGKLLEPGFGTKVFTWKGELIHEGFSEDTPTASVSEYVKSALYSKDYLALAKVSFGEPLVGPGGSVERGHSFAGSLGEVFHGRPGSLFVDYFVASEKENEELNWKTLRMILEKMNDRWFLVDVAVMGWIP